MCWLPLGKVLRGDCHLCLKMGFVGHMGCFFPSIPSASLRALAASVLMSAAVSDPIELILSALFGVA